MAKLHTRDQIGGITIRILAVGIFVIENINHIVNFKGEVNEIVRYAIDPLPLWLAYALHGCTIVLGLTGSILVCLIAHAFVE